MLDAYIIDLKSNKPKTLINQNSRTVLIRNSSGWLTKSNLRKFFKICFLYYILPYDEWLLGLIAKYIDSSDSFKIFFLHHRKPQIVFMKMVVEYFILRYNYFHVKIFLKVKKYI